MRLGKTMKDAKGKILPEEIAALVEEWKDKKEAYREAFGDGWPAKLVSTSFTYKGEEYVLEPDQFAREAISIYMYEWESGLMECYQHDLEKDLRALGAENLFSNGFLD